MGVCAASHHWRLEKKKDYYYVRFTGGLWYVKLLSYVGGYLFIVPLGLVLISLFFAFLRDHSAFYGGLLVLVLALFYILFKTNREFLFTVVRFNFIKRTIGFGSFNVRYYYSLNFDIGYEDNAFILIVQIRERDKKKSIILEWDLKIWQSTSLTKVKKVQKILQAEYEKGRNLYTSKELAPDT